jgi:hypothetical protein
MPQFTEFPILPKGEYRTAVDGFIRFWQQMPAAGEPFKDFRTRLKKVELWNRERLSGLLRFMQVAEADPALPSPLVRSLVDADGDAARDLLAERLWTVNPLLFKSVVDLLQERVHSPNEILKYVDSFAYPGARLSSLQVRTWIAFAQGLELLKPVGIRLALDKRGEKFAKRAEELDVDEFLEQDEDEPAPAAVLTVRDEGEPGPAPAAAPVEVPAPIVAPVVVQAPPSPTAALPSPLGRGAPVDPRRYAGQAVFADDVLDEARARLSAWWAEQSGAAPAPGAADFGVDAEAWMEDGERALYRVAVGAALLFRLGRGERAALDAFASLDGGGFLDALYHGTAPEGPPVPVDPQALMLASLVARRWAEVPSLAADLERQRTAADAFRTLESALGRGLFGLELFWILRTLGRAGVLRPAGLAEYSGLPDRAVRDTLYRLGFLASPYAPDAAALAVASAAAHRATGDADAPDRVLAAFSRAAGCAYGCPNRRRCDLPCRERADLA